MPKRYLPILLLFLFAVKQPCTAQTAQQYKDKSDGFYYTLQFDSALHYARLAEVLIVDTFTRNSKEYAWFSGQFFSMNYEQKRSIDSALYWYRYSLHLFDSLSDTLSLEYGETLVNYGNMLNDLGYYTEALPYLQKAVAVMNNYEEDFDAYLGSKNNLANNYNYCGEYVNAEMLYRFCLEKLEQNPTRLNPQRKGRLLYNLATIYTKTSSVKEAEKYFKEAAIVLKMPYTLYEYYETRKNLAALYLASNRTKDAETIFIELLNDGTLKKHNGNDPKDLLATQYVETLNGLGNVKELLKKYTEAETLYEQSMAIARKLTDTKAIYSATGCLAHLYAITRRHQQADSLYSKMFAAFEGQREYDHYTYLFVYVDYCENLVKLKQLQKALKKIKHISEMLFADLYKNFTGMTESSQMNYMLSLNRYKSLLSSIVSRQDISTDESVGYALNRLLQLKGMILTYQQRRLQSLRVSSDTGLTYLSKKLQAIKQTIYSNTCGISTATINMDSLDAAAKMYEQAIAAKSGVLPESINELLVDKINSRLQPGEAAIEFVRYQQSKTGTNQYGAFIIRRGRAPLFVELCTEAALKKCFITSETGFNTLHQIDNSAAVYKKVWKPVAAHLQDVHTIYYSPDGLINYISFDAIAVQPGTYLINQKKLVQLSNLRSVLATAKPYKLEKAVLWGSIDCSEIAYLQQKASPVIRYASGTKGIDDSIKGFTQKGFPSLQDDELPAIAGLVQNKKLPSKIYQARLATEEAFKQDATDFKDLLHISSHGFYAMNPADTNNRISFSNSFTTQVNPLMRCGLILSGANYVWSGKAPLPGREDGVLTGYEIAMMDLSKVKLVVLSACETGLGDIDAGSEGVLGLQRAFKLAGVDKLILSLWNVNAKYTEQLMVLFYKNLLRGNTPAVALRTAKLTLAKENPPYAWAGFVLIE